MLPALLIDVIAIFPCSPIFELGVFVVFDPAVFNQCSGTAPSCCSMPFENARGSPRPFKNTHPDVLIMRAALAAN
jgi:hypothetical protein